MKTYDVQSIEIAVSAKKAHRYIADPKNLPVWTNAFANADETSAVMRTPDGEVRLNLHTRSDVNSGIIDWKITFPDGSKSDAYSRVVPTAADRCVYTFVLLAPPVPLEMLEGALNAQVEILAKELVAVKNIVEAL